MLGIFSHYLVLVMKLLFIFYHIYSFADYYLKRMKRTNWFELAIYSRVQFLIH
jgi:hypothetical protein